MSKLNSHDEPNPYQSPTGIDDPLNPDAYYVGTLGGLRYIELWRICERWDRFVFGAIWKALGIPSHTNFAFKALQPLQILHQDELSATGREKLQPGVDAYHHLGLRFAFYCTSERTGPADGYAAYFLDRSATIAAGLIWAHIRAKRAVSESLNFFLMTWLESGIVVTTSNRRRQLDAPANFQRVHVPGATLPDLLRLHSDRLSAIPPEGVVRLSPERLLDRLNANKRLAAEFNIRRGVWVPQQGKPVSVDETS